VETRHEEVGLLWRRCRRISRRLHHVFQWYFEGRLWRFLADVRTSLRWTQALQTLSPERSTSSRMGSRVLAGLAAASDAGVKRAADRRTDDAPTRAVYRQSHRPPRRAVNLALSPSYARDLASPLYMAPHVAAATATLAPVPSASDGCLTSTTWAGVGNLRGIRHSFTSPLFICRFLWIVWRLPRLGPAA
jgi:hypothetical protein